MEQKQVWRKEIISSKELAGKLEFSWGTENSGLAFCGPGAPSDMLYVVLEIAHK